MRSGPPAATSREPDESYSRSLTQHYVLSSGSLRITGPEPDQLLTSPAAAPAAACCACSRIFLSSSCTARVSAPRIGVVLRCLGRRRRNRCEHTVVDMECDRLDGIDQNLGALDVPFTQPAICSLKQTAESTGSPPPPSISMEPPDQFRRLPVAVKSYRSGRCVTPTMSVAHPSS
jgi:hypothetical protein